MPLFLAMVLICFSVFVLVLGVYSTRDMMASHRRRSRR